MKYEIQHYTLCDGWINTWSYYEDDHEYPTFFETFEEALDSLDEFLDDEQREFEQGNIESPYLREEFRIVKLEGVTA